MYRKQYKRYGQSQWKTKRNSYAVDSVVAFPMTLTDSNLDFIITIFFNVK